MLYRLALDIGTASCGLIAVGLDSQGEPDKIVHHGLYIFSEPLMPPKAGGIGEPKKAARRSARLARRVIDRRARRLKRIAYLADLLGLDHRSIPADKGQRIHALRAEAVTGRIGLDDLLRVLLKLAKRRGYKGSFKVRKEKDEGVVEPGIKHLEQQMADANYTTLGQYLHKRFEEGNTLKLKEAGLYAHRDMLETEFNAVWDEQAKHHPILSESRPDPLDGHKRNRPIRNQFFDAIFYQRPLKSVAPMVGNCALEPSLPRAPMAQPAMQAFRIEKQLADLRWGMGRNSLPLSKEQRDAVREMLSDPEQLLKEGKLKFEKIYKRLASVPKIPGQRDTLNMERSSREDLTGNRTLRAMRDLGLFDEWLALEDITRLRVMNFLADLGSPDQVDQTDWHLRFSRPLDLKLVAFIDRMVETKKFDRLPKMGFDSGRASYSIRALERLTATMREHGCDEHDAIRRCYPPPEATGELLPQLPPHPATGNVVVDVALRQVRRAVNEALAKLGKPPAEVVIELSRDMALGIKARGEIEKRIDKNRRQRETAKKALESNDPPIAGTDRNVLRYILWQQQDTHCPYCGERISFGQAVDGNATHFEHILPRSLTRVGKQRNHLVLAHRRCNDAKGDRTPYEAFGHDEDRWRAVEFCASVLKANKQFAKARLLTLVDYEHEVLDDDSITDFSERQFAETSWIGKLAAQWMKDVCTKVSVSRGLLTAHLRRLWKLETVIAQARFDAGLPVLDADGEKIAPDDFKRFKPFWEGHTGKDLPRTDRKIDKRIDHRHHLIDALVIAQTSRSLYQRMARHYKELAERRATGEAVRMTFSVEPPLGDVRNKALTLICNTEIHHKPDRLGGGPFFQEFAYGTTHVDDDDRLYLCRRKKLSSFAAKADPVDKVRKQLKSIASPSIRALVQAAFEERIRNGKTPYEALQTPITNPSYRNEIKAVNCIHGLAESSTVVTHGSRDAVEPHHKTLIDDGWERLEITKINGKKIETRLVSPRMAAQSSADQSGTNHTVFCKGDTVFDTSTGARYVIRQIKAQAGGLLVMTPVVDARSVRDMSSAEGLKTISGSGLTKLTHM